MELTLLVLIAVALQAESKLSKLFDFQIFELEFLKFKFPVFKLKFVEMLSKILTATTWQSDFKKIQIARIHNYFLRTSVL